MKASPAITDIAAILDVLQNLLPDGAALHEPALDQQEQEYATECIESGWISSVSPFVNQFEKMIGDVVGANHVVSTVNGTAALHTVLAIMGVLPGDEVIIPSFTFVATASAVTYCGAHPHFVDVDERTLGLDPLKLERYFQNVLKSEGGSKINRITGRPIRAVVCMHTFGHPVDMEPLIKLCEDAGLPLIEDAAESLGSSYRGRQTGTLGQCGILSFNGNKIVTTGGGGAIVTNDPQLAERARHLATTAKTKHPWETAHDEIGFNYRMPGINAAVGCAQLKKLPHFLNRKRQLAKIYLQAFAGLAGVEMYQEQPFANSNYWLNTLILNDDDLETRNAILEKCHGAGIFARPPWRPLHQLAPYETCPRSDLSVSESLYRRIINLPSSAELQTAPADAA